MTTPTRAIARGGVARGTDGHTGAGVNFTPQTRGTMIGNLIIILFLAVFSLEQLGAEKLIPSKATWIPELMSAMAAVIVVFAAAKRRTIDVAPAQLFLGALILVHIVCGILVNSVGPGVVFAGIRTYLKYAPFFLIPMLFRFSEKQLTTQFKFLLAITLIQLPLALYQRFVVSAGATTGDRVVGTLVVSSHLSIYLIAFVAVLLAAFLKGKISRTVFGCLLILVLMPTTINETKGTFILLPFALLVPVLFNPGDPFRFRRVLAVSLIGVIFVAAYIPIYDHFMYARYGKSIAEYWTDTEGLQMHFAPQTLGVHDNRVGRVDAMLEPAKQMGNDPVKLFFGLGIGNVADSALGKKFTGEHYEEHGWSMYLAVSHLQWEVGLFGLLLVMILWLLFARDAKALAGRDDAYGVLALGWLGVLAVLFVSLFYKDIINANQISYVFWFYSGALVAEAHRVRRSTRWSVMSGTPRQSGDPWKLSGIR